MLYICSSSNYIYLNDFKNAHKYYNEFKTLKVNPNIVKYNYFSFEAGIKSCFADVFFTRKQIDSSLSYLKSSTPLKAYMGEDVLKDYYRLFADIHEYLEDFDKSKVYMDSLLLLQNEMFDKTIQASFDLNDTLIKTESELMAQNEKNTFNSVLSAFLLLILLLLSVFSFLYFRKEKQTFENYSNQKNDNLSYLKSNNNQLALKVHGLEAYIKKLKLEVKQISRTEGVGNQKEKIKDLYKNLHINSSTLLDKSESHLEIVNELNIEFFKQIEGKYPQLNKSEIIICYYLFMGFTNKEIAIFLNTTIRSVESRRYRISKKINFNKKKTTLLKYLQNTFSETLNQNH